MRELLYHILFAPEEPLLGPGPVSPFSLCGVFAFLGMGLFDVQLPDCATAPPPAQAAALGAQGENWDEIEGKTSLTLVRY